MTLHYVTTKEMAGFLCLGYTRTCNAICFLSELCVTLNKTRASERQHSRARTRVPVDVRQVERILGHALHEQIKDGGRVLLAVLAQHVKRVLTPAVCKTTYETSSDPCRV